MYSLKMFTGFMKREFFINPKNQGQVLKFNLKYLNSSYCIVIIQLPNCGNSDLNKTLSDLSNTHKSEKLGSQIRKMVFCIIERVLYSTLVATLVITNLQCRGFATFFHLRVRRLRQAIRRRVYQAASKLACRARSLFEDFQDASKHRDGVD